MSSIESKIIKSDERFLLRTTTVEDRPITDPIDAGRQIGRQRFWAWTKMALGGMEMLGGGVLEGAAIYMVGGEIIQNTVNHTAFSFDLNVVALFFGLSALAIFSGWNTAKNGFHEENMFYDQYVTLKGSTSISITTFQELQTPAEPEVEEELINPIETPAGTTPALS